MLETQNVTDAQINTLINQGLHEIEVFTDWRFLQDFDNLTVVAGTQTYSIGTLTTNTFNRAIALVDDDIDATVDYIPPSEFFSRYGNDTGNTSTRARTWTVFQGNIYLHPIPSENDTARYRLYYFKTITELSGDSSVPEFHSGFHWMLVEYGKWKLWEREEYFDQAEKSRQYFNKMLEDMQHWYARVTREDPWIVGDGRFLKTYRDPNLPILDGG
jgi:hypothetical protein